VLKALLAVWLSLVGPSVYRLLQFPLVHVMRFCERWDTPSSNGETLPLLQEPQPHYNGSPSTPEVQGSSKASSVLSKSNGGGELFKNAVFYAYQGANRHKLALVLMGLVFLASFAARAAAGVLSALVATNGAALWNSDKCGLYRFDNDGAGDEAAARADVFDRAKETRAGEYAKYCYNSSSALPLRCGFFYETEIKFNTTYQYKCPFPKEDICIRGSPAVTFDTGLVAASSIGINDPYGYRFRRSTTCTPLSTESPYVRNGTDNRTADYTYFYGETGDTDYTFRSTGDPFNWLVSSYDVKSALPTPFFGLC